MACDGAAIRRVSLPRQANRFHPLVLNRRSGNEGNNRLARSGAKPHHHPLLLLEVITVTGANGVKISLGSWIYDNLFTSWASPKNASLAFAIAFVLVWLGLMWILYRRKIFIKI